MSPLDEAVTQLLDEATRPRLSDAVHGAAGNVAKAIAGESRPDLDRAIERLLPALDAPHAQGGRIVALTCGAMVEAGGSPEPVARAILARVPRLFEAAMSFRSAVAKLDEIDADADGARQVGSRFVDGESVQTLVDESPEAALSYFALDLFCRPLIATLSRAPSLLRSSDAAATRASLSPFEEDGEYTYFLGRLLRVPLDEEWVVIDPTIERGFVVAVSGVANAFQVYCLLHDALGRESTLWQRLFSSGSGLLPTGIPPREFVAVASGAGPQQTSHTYVPAFTLFRWSAILPGHDVPGTENVHDWYSNSAVPAELSMFEGRRVAVLGRFSIRMELAVSREFDGLHASVGLVRALDRESVRRLLRQLADAPRPPRPVPGVG